MSWLKQLFCKHILEVVRYHQSVVQPELRKKLLYIDRHKVHNFIQCGKCGTVFDTAQRDKLFDSEVPDELA
jgi:hypothetical protein